jgi:hypothetical protein
LLSTKSANETALSMRADHARRRAIRREGGAPSISNSTFSRAN